MCINAFFFLLDSVVYFSIKATFPCTNRIHIILFVEAWTLFFQSLAVGFLCVYKCKCTYNIHLQCHTIGNLPQPNLQTMKVEFYPVKGALNISNRLNQNPPFVFNESLGKLVHLSFTQ